jgi:hypothetical protein
VFVKVSYAFQPSDGDAAPRREAVNHGRRRIELEATISGAGSLVGDFVALLGMTAGM